MSAQVQNKTQQPQQQQQPKTTTTTTTLVPGELKNPTQPTATINTNDATMSDASNLPNAPASAAAAAEEALKEKPIPSAAEKPIVTDEDGEPPINMDEDEDVQPVSSDSDEDEVDFDAEECTFEKGNITKKILRKGDGPRPPLGSEVYVHYVGRLLDGKEFDSSRSRGTQFHFKLGKGAVIKGWDKGVAAMRKGELAELTISSEYAYGASGSPPSIPPNSTLKFEIELFSWEHRVSVTEDQGVMKELITAGSGYAKPNDGATVHIKYTAQLKDGQVFDKRYEEKAFEFKVGEDYSVPRGLDEAVKNMEKGEKSKFLFRPKYGFDTRGNAELEVPPNASLEYVIELVDFTKARETWEMKSDEKLELAKKRKTQGNELFKLERWDEAFGRYDAATKVIRHDGDLTAEQKTALNTLKEQCYNNSAACKAKLEQWSDVIKFTTDALGLEKNSVKALFRRGQAYARTNENDLAVADFKAALALDPNNEAVKKALAPVQARIRQLKEKEKKLFSGMFNRVKLVGEEEAKKVAAAAAKKPKTKKTKASTESSEPAQESSSVTESSDAASPQPKESAAPAAMDVDQSASTAK